MALCRGLTGFSHYKGKKDLQLHNGVDAIQPPHYRGGERLGSARCPPCLLRGGRRARGYSTAVGGYGLNTFRGGREGGRSFDGCSSNPTPAAPLTGVHGIRMRKDRPSYLGAGWACRLLLPSHRGSRKRCTKTTTPQPFPRFPPAGVGCGSVSARHRPWFPLPPPGCGSGPWPRPARSLAFVVTAASAALLSNTTPAPSIPL